MEVRQFVNYIHSQLSILCLSSQVTTNSTQISNTQYSFGIEMFLPENEEWQIVPVTSFCPQSNLGF